MLQQFQLQYDQQKIINPRFRLDKFFHGFCSLINRKFFIDEYQRQYPSMIQQCQENTEFIDASYRAEKYSPPPMFGVPATTSALFWSVGISTGISQISEAPNSTIPQIFQVPEMIPISENTAYIQEKVD
jgi:hypothetical protein